MNSVNDIWDKLRNRMVIYARSKAIVFSATSFGASLMHSVFQFYYVKVYIDYYHLPESWFNWMQMVYMVWNAINDPLLGYCQDHCHAKIVRSRRHTIYYGAPVWAATFLLPWFPWTTFGEGNAWLCGLHLVTALCAYDTLFTHVLLAHGCVFAEMAETHEERVDLYWHSTIASLLGSTSVLFCEAFSSHLSDFFAFQLCCVVIAVIAWLSVAYTGKYAVTKYDLISSTGVKISADLEPQQVVSSDRSTEFSVIQLTWQILSQRNFFWFVLLNFCGEFHSNFVASMSRVISEVLVSPYVSTTVWSLYCGAIMILPRLMLLTIFPLLSRYGYCNMYRISFILIMCFAVMMYIIGGGYPLLFMTYTLINSILAGNVSLMGLALSDIIDEDYHKYSRRHPVSSMVFGTNALITKPALSLAPMLAVRVLNSHGYQDYQNSTLSGEDLLSLSHAMLTLSCLLPLCVGLMQAIFLSQYTIRNSHVKVSKYTET